MIGQYINPLAAPEIARTSDPGSERSDRKMVARLSWIVRECS